jgi:hypothetical protein
MPISALFALIAPTLMSKTAPVQLPTENRVAAYVERLRTDLRSVESFFNLGTAPETLNRLDAFFEAKQKDLEKSTPARPNLEEEIDLVLSKNFLGYRRTMIGIEQARIKETDPLLPFASDILKLEQDRRLMKAIDSRTAADVLSGIAKSAKSAREKLVKAIEAKKGIPGIVVADRAAKRLDNLLRTLQFWYGQYDGFHPLFSWWAKKPQESAVAELKAYMQTLREKVAGYKEGDDAPLIGDPIGRKALMVDIESEMLDWTPEDLIAMAEREYAWCESEAKKASREMGMGDDWRKAMDKVKSLHVEPGEQDQLVVDQAKEAIKFLEDRKLVTIEPLCKETWRLEMLGQETQKTLPFAVYMGQKMGVSYPLATQDHETKEMSLRGNNEHFTRAITHHELIPGHHLQGYMAERYNSHRRLFSTPFLVEGWALYWEMLLWDLGFARGPEDRVGMLFWRMHRCARIIVSLKFHLGEMKPVEMIDFLVDKVGHERFTATSEVRRFIGGDYSPLYQCAYMIGGLQLRELERELVGGKKMSHREFHDAILHSGPIPIKLIGKRLRSVAKV